MTDTAASTQPDPIEQEVAFERNTQGIPRSTLDRASAAKFKLELFYKNITQYVREREERLIHSEQRKLTHP